MPEWIAGKVTTFEIPEVIQAYRALDRARELAVGDPELEEIADLFAELFTRGAELQPDPVESPIDPMTVAMVDAESIGKAPGWQHLTRLLRQRGWVFDWNDIRPPRYDPSVAGTDDDDGHVVAR